MFFTKDELSEVFKAGFDFRADAVNNPSNSEYVEQIFKDKKQEASINHTLCSKCGKPHFLGINDAGTEQELRRLCFGCFNNEDNCNHNFAELWYCEDNIPFELFHDRKCTKCGFEDNDI